MKIYLFQFQFKNNLIVLFHNITRKIFLPHVFQKNTKSGYLKLDHASHFFLFSNLLLNFHLSPSNLQV
jgi:hypothetical protein